MAIPYESTATLLNRTRQGDTEARERLARAYLPILKRLAHGRLPAAARSLLDTDDLVQLTLSQAFLHLNRFEPRHEGAFLAYLRQILINRIRDEARRARVRPVSVPIDPTLPSSEPSPLETAAGRELVERYEAALNRLNPLQRQAIVLRLEMGFSHEQIALALESSSANAARMIVARAVVQLAGALREEPSPTDE